MKIFFVLPFIFFACSKGDKKAPIIVDTPVSPSLVKKIMYKDTLVVLGGIDPVFKPPNDSVGDEKTKATLHKHFRGKGYVIPGESPPPFSEENYVVMYYRRHDAYLTQDTLTDAIVEYWLIPSGGTGSCFLPHKAMLIQTRKGPKLMHVDFIDPSLEIDSVGHDPNLILYCSEIDCSNHKSRTHYAVRIAAEISTR
jgi:hypothetical protein